MGARAGCTGCSCRRPWRTGEQEHCETQGQGKHLHQHACSTQTRGARCDVWRTRNTTDDGHAGAVDCGVAPCTMKAPMLF
eukprot:scaffold18656_cov146-Isochrysis_galbana.AAC.4